MSKHHNIQNILKIFKQYPTLCCFPSVFGTQYLFCEGREGGISRAGEWEGCDRVKFSTRCRRHNTCTFYAKVLPEPGD